MFTLFFKLLVGHALSDFALQTEWMAKNKNRYTRYASQPPNFEDRGPLTFQTKPTIVWPYALTSHALIQGGCVYLVTGSIYFGVIETILHWIIDYGKGEEWYQLDIDQLLHITCKVGYVIFM